MGETSVRRSAREKSRHDATRHKKKKKKSVWIENARGSDGFPRAESGLWRADRKDGGASSPRAPASFVLGRHAPSWHRRTYRVARCVSSPRARGVSRTRSVAARARTRRASPAADRTSRQPHLALPPARPRGARPIAASPRRPHPWRSPREARGLPEVRSRCHRRLAAACGTVIRGTAGQRYSSGRDDFVQAGPFDGQRFAIRRRREKELAREFL